MPKSLTLQGPGRLGNLLWDDELGTFQGTDADLIAECADTPQSHPAYGSVSATARKDAKALIVLLACLGWDAPPELASEHSELRKAAGSVPRDAVV